MLKKLSMAVLAAALGALALVAPASASSWNHNETFLKDINA